MENSENTEGWIYVIVSNPGKDENFLGLHDNEKDIDFIPAFSIKDDANDCFLSLPREKGVKYEVQAILLEDLSQTASDNGFIVAMVDNDGNIVKMI